MRRPRLLDVLRACLACGLDGRPLDAASAAALADPGTDLVRLAHLADRHLVTPMLHAAVAGLPTGRGRLEDFALYLKLIHDRNARRNETLTAQLRQLGRGLNAAGIEPVLLKGAIRLVDGLYPDPGWRFMRDLDLLIPPAAAPAAVACLEALGYAADRDEDSAEAGHGKHLPPFGRKGEPAVVELHTELLPERRALCPAELVLTASRPVDLGGARVRVPAAVDQLAHLVGHDQSDGYLRRSGMFRLRSTLELALLCRDPAQVPRLVARADAAGLARWTLAQLRLASRLFPGVFAHPPAGGSLGAGILLALEHGDESGRLRRLAWFARMRAGKLVASPAERRHLGRHLLSAGYRRRCAARLARLWVSD